MKSIIRTDKILAPEISDGTFGREVLSICANSDLDDLYMYPFLSGKIILRLFQAEIAPSRQPLIRAMSVFCI